MVARKIPNAGPVSVQQPNASADHVSLKSVLPFSTEHETYNVE